MTSISPTAVSVDVEKCSEQFAIYESILKFGQIHCIRTFTFCQLVGFSFNETTANIFFGYVTKNAAGFSVHT